MSDDLQDAIHKLETKHRVETYLMKIGASDEAARLLASSEHAKKFKWDGVNLSFDKSDLAAVDDENAKAFFHSGPFSALFVKPKEPGSEGHAEIDPVVLASAKSGNMTAKGRLLVESFNGDLKALDAALADKGNGDHDAAANGGRANGAVNDHGSNPFLRLRDPRTGKINPAAEQNIASLIKAVGTKKATEIARAAKTAAAPYGMTLTGLPIKQF